MKSTDRLHLIDQLIRENRLPNLDKINEILRKTGDKLISDRQFFRDIETLKTTLENRYPNEKESLLLYNRSKKGYEYKSGYSAFSDFSRKEVKTIADLAEELINHKHLFLGSKNAALYEKIKAFTIEQEYAKGNENISWSPVSLIEEGKRFGQEHFDEMIEYIQKKCPIEMEYTPIGRDKKIINCLPVLVKEYNSGWYSGWYLLALPIYENPNFYRLINDDLNMYALDRIGKITPSKLNPKITIPKDFDPKNYFKYLIGIVRYNLGKNASTKKEQIHLETTQEWINYYLPKYPIHHTQRISKKHIKVGSIHLTLELEITFELENYLFRHSGELRVLKPKFLRDRIMTRLNDTLENY